MNSKNNQENSKSKITVGKQTFKRNVQIQNNKKVCQKTL